MAEGNKRMCLAVGSYINGPYHPVALDGGGVEIFDTPGECALWSTTLNLPPLPDGKFYAFINLNEHNCDAVIAINQEATHETE